MSLIIVGDFTSVYVALRRGVDPTPVEVIDRLKAALAGACVGMTQALPRALRRPGEPGRRRRARRRRTSCRASRVVLGSGLGPALGEDLRGDRLVRVHGPARASPRPACRATRGAWSWGSLAGVPVAAFFGRVHFYEGHGMDVPALLPRLAQALGADTIVLTAAVGGRRARPARRYRRRAAGSPQPDGDGAPAGVALPRRHARVHPHERRLRSRPRDAGRVERAEALGIRSADRRLRRDERPGLRDARGGARSCRAPAPPWWACRWCPRPCRRGPSACGSLGLCSVTNALGEEVAHEEVVRVSNETAIAVGRLLVDLLPRL